MILYLNNKSYRKQVAFPELSSKFESVIEHALRTTLMPLHLDFCCDDFCPISTVSIRQQSINHITHLCLPHVVDADPPEAGEVSGDGSGLAGSEHRQQPSRIPVLDSATI